MSEKVQERLEAMLPELEDLKSRKIFNEAEIAAIVKKRTGFEYAISRRIAKKADYLRYVAYEMNLEKLRLKRKSRLPRTKSSLSDYSGPRRINTLFERALMKFKGDLKLWLQYLDHLHLQKSNQLIGKVYAKAIRYLPHTEVLWVQAANWEFKHNLNMEAARTLMQRAIRLNKKSRTLFCEFFRLELMYIAKIKLRQHLLFREREREQKENESIIIPTLEGENEEDMILKKDSMTNLPDSSVQGLSESSDFMKGAIPKVIFLSAIESLPEDFEVRSRFLDILELYDGFDELNQFIFETIMRDFKNDERVLDLSIRRKLNGVKPDTKEWIDAIAKVISGYEETLNDIDTPEMMTFFINFLFKVFNNTTETNLKKYLSLKLKAHLKNAQEKTQHNPEYYLPADFYRIYTKFAGEHLKDYKLVQKLLIESTEKHPTVPEFWIERIKAISTEDIEERRDILENAIDYNYTSNQLWSQYLNYSLLLLEKYQASEVSDGDELSSDQHHFKKQEDFFLRSLNKLQKFHTNNEAELEERNNTRNLIHKTMVSWAYKVGGIEYLRSFAQRFRNSTFMSSAIYSTWIEIELKHFEQHNEEFKETMASNAQYSIFKDVFDRRLQSSNLDQLRQIEKLYEEWLNLNRLDIEVWLHYASFLFMMADSSHSAKLLLRAKQMLPKQEYAILEAEYRNFVAQKKEQLPIKA